jgi:NAD(P)H-nitrite reductase large subunit
VDIASATVCSTTAAPCAYDRLLIATGSSPATPPIPGIAGAGVHPCWTLADARAIMALAKPGARVVQMGAGFIGCIIMEALAARGVKLSVVEMGDRMVPRMMGPTAGGMIKPGAGQGCRRLHRRPRRAIERDPRRATVMKVRLSTGQCWRPTWSSAPPA